MQRCKIPLLFCDRTGCGMVSLQGEGAGSGSCSHRPRAAPMSMLALGGMGRGAAQLQLCFCKLWNESVKLKWVWKPLLALASRLFALNIILVEIFVVWH